jgi:hypothetical protein
MDFMIPIIIGGIAIFGLFVYALWRAAKKSRNPVPPQR